MFDVILVGAGPAGSAAARAIASGGWRVAVGPSDVETAYNMQYARRI